MVDVSAKPETVREAIARARLKMLPATLRAIREGNAPKGDVLGVARTAGVLAAKRTPELIPLCHPLRITGVDITFTAEARRGELTVEARVRTVDKTGVEMEALTAVSVAALTVYDMVKAIEKGVTIADIHLVEKSGGKSGRWTRNNAPTEGHRTPKEVRSQVAPAAGHRAAKEVRSQVAPAAGHPRPKPASAPPSQ
jgi:cyclic pyranopterin phosphate synthase